MFGMCVVVVVVGERVCMYVCVCVAVYECCGRVRSSVGVQFH